MVAAIPLDDADAALRFCHSLAEFLQQNDLTPSAGPIPDISIVVPAFNEAENLPELYRRLTKTLDAAGSSYELVFVDDGSRDATPVLLEEMARGDPRVVVLELARNFGHQTAISAGLEHARGRGVIVMDADLQDPPEVLPQFIAQWQAGHDVVFAVREQRKENPIKRSSYAAFYRLLYRVADIEIPIDAGDFCIMDRRVVDVLLAMPERTRFVRGLRSWVGLDQVGLAYERMERHAGQPKYSFQRLIYLALDGLVSFSYLPLRLISLLGIVVSTFSLILAVFYAVKKLLVGLNPPGFATLIVSILFFAGLQLVTLGVIGEYIGRIYEEVKRRPLYVLRRVIRTPS
jgi:dolichol-phosphate mannosyltransferase